MIFTTSLNGFEFYLKIELNLFRIKCTWYRCQLVLVKALRMAETNPLWTSKITNSVPVKLRYFM